MEKLLNNRFLKLSLKVFFSLAAIIYVILQIDWAKAFTVLATAHLTWILAGLVFFNLSQAASAFRSKTLFESINLKLSIIYNIKLYYLGMFYNLLLPGGVGGDAYKVYYLKNKFKKRTRRLVKAVLLDRISGLHALIVLIIIFLYLLHLPQKYYSFLPFMLCMLYPFFFGLWHALFRRFMKKFIQVNFLSVCIQLLQVTTVISIALALKINSDIEYYILTFLLSSIATVVPITIGGLGLREVVFLSASTYLDFNHEKAVTLSLIFFLITVVSSLPGIFLNINTKKSSADLSNPSFA